MRWIFLVLGAVAAGCAGPKEASTKDQPRDVLDRAPKTLPLLRGRHIQPIEEKDRFVPYFDGSYSFSKGGPADPREHFNTDEAAIGAATAFLREHFGDLGDPLICTALTRSSRGHQRPVMEDGGYTITLRSRHGEVLVEDSNAVVSIAGRTVTSATVSLLAVEPIAGSEGKVLSGERAIRIWKEAVEKAFKVKDALPRRAELRYFSKGEDRSSRDGAVVLAPNWDFGQGILVDAFTGRLWRND